MKPLKIFPIEAIQTDFNIGMSIKEICKKYDTKSYLIDYYFKKHNILRQRIVKFVPKQDDIKDIVSSYRDKILSITDLCKKYHTRNVVVRKILTEHNIRIRPASESSKKYNIDERFLDELDSVEKYWYLGWFAADGHVSKNMSLICFILSRKDIEMLYIFKKLFNYNGPLRFKSLILKHGNIGEYAILNLVNKYLHKKIREIGFNNNKTESLKWVNYPENFMPHFLRGYFEGDGNVFINKRLKKCEASIVSSADFCYGLQKFCKEKLGINALIEELKSSNPNCPAKTVRFSGNGQTFKFLNYIYRDNKGYFLSRKRNYIIDALKFYIENIKRSIKNAEIYPLAVDMLQHIENIPQTSYSID